MLTSKGEKEIVKVFKNLKFNESTHATLAISPIIMTGRKSGNPDNPLKFLTKASELYSLTLKAKNLLAKYQDKLTQTKSFDNCITPLSSSTKFENLFYKREDLTVINAYKVRGALFQTSEYLISNPDKKLHFVAASTGNHALGVLKTAEILKLSKVTVCISENVTLFKKEKLRNKALELQKCGVDAQILVKGKTFDETNAYAKNLAEQDENTFFVDPYGNKLAVGGQGSIGLEILSQLNDRISKGELTELEEITLVVTIDGGSLISEISCAVKLGAQKLKKKKKLNFNVTGVKLNDFNSLYGDAIKVKTPGEYNNDFLNAFVDEKVVINDFDMKKGIKFVENDINKSVEGASAGTLKPVLDGSLKPDAKHAVVCVLSGSNSGK